MGTRTYYVYMLSNARRNVLYIGVTNSLRHRLQQHREGLVAGFTKTYRTSDLLWYEAFDSINNAIAREKQLKNWHRDWKWNLIRTSNPDLLDLAPELIHL